VELSAQRIALFEKHVRKIMKEHQAPGVAITLAQGENIFYAKGFGVRNQRKEPATPDTIFGIASVTKCFTAVAIAELVASGKLHYDDPITKHLPEVMLQNGMADEVTIHHLLTHTSGLAPLPALRFSLTANSPLDHEEPVATAALTQNKKKKTRAVPVNTYADLIHYISKYKGPFYGKPGEYFSYSNDCYALLGAIISRTSGQTYAAYVKDNILRPLGMSRTMFSFEEMLEHDNVTELYYRTEKDEFQHSTRWPVAPPYLAGGWLKSTAMDLIKLPQMLAQKGLLRGARLLPEESVLINTKPYHQFSLLDSYSYGLRIRPDYHGLTLIEHGGALKGVSSTAGFVPERELSAVVLCNMSGVPAFKIWLAAVNLALGLPIETPRHVYATKDWASDCLERFTGRFLSGEGATFDIVTCGNELEIRLKHEACVIKCINDHTGLYTLKGQETEIRFFFGEDDLVCGVGIGMRIIPKVSELRKSNKFKDNVNPL